MMDDEERQASRVRQAGLDVVPLRGQLQVGDRGTLHGTRGDEKLWIAENDHTSAFAKQIDHFVKRPLRRIVAHAQCARYQAEDVEQPEELRERLLEFVWQPSWATDEDWNHATESLVTRCPSQAAKDSNKRSGVSGQ